MKRAFDVAGSAAALVLAGPLLAVLAWLIRREDGGPALFRQIRIGRHRRPFAILKLRTMRVAPGPALTAAGDPRVTAIGALLRRSRLDELPQLWNVLRGDMSFVGPRPELAEHAAMVPPEAERFFELRPGLTGLAQLDGLDEERELALATDPDRHYAEVLLPRKVAAALRYGDEQTLRLDLTILFRTAIRLFRTGVGDGSSHRKWLALALAGRRPIIQAIAIVVSLAAYLMAYLIRADFRVPSAWWPEVIDTLPFLIGARLIAFRHYGLFQGWWKYAGVNDFLDIIKASTVGSAFFVTAVVLTFGVYAVPRSVVLIDWVLVIGLLSGTRVLSRLFGTWLTGVARPKERAIVVGDLRSIEPLVRDLSEGSELGFEPVGLVTLGGVAVGRRLHGVPVLGGEDALPTVIESAAADVVLLALSRRQAAVLRRILSACSRLPVRFQLVPPLRDQLGMRPRLQALRDLSVDDLLGRDEVQIDDKELRDTLAGKRVLVTGAAGSIGSELARQISRYGPQALLLLDRNEPALVSLDEELRGQAPTLALLGDIRHRAHLRALFAEHRPEIVFHAAAYKHVPMMELNPVEAVKNNVLGTHELICAADDFGAEKFVLISTDKAVKPINIMGSSKRVAERLLDASSKCRKLAVRFGNVLGSDGSVVPILLRQIRKGGPVTITHPDATRYFMTIPEAVQLVLQASHLGRGGEIFVLDMGEPVRILDLALSLIRLSGLTPGRDIEVRITGLRPGERLHEEPLLDEEAVPAAHEKLWVRQTDSGSGIVADISTLAALVASGDAAAVLEWLQRQSESRPMVVH